MYPIINSSDSDNDYEELRDSMDLITEFIESEDSSLDDGSDLSDSNTVNDNDIEENNALSHLAKT